MNQKGKVLGFGRYSEKMIDDMKQNLGIAMPTTLLMRVAAHYRYRERRDPFIEELRMLDAFFAHVPPFISIHELCTNDAFVARTYTDVMEKFRELDKTEPPTVSSVLSTASESLRRAGKRISGAQYTFGSLPRRFVAFAEDLSVESNAENGLTVRSTATPSVNTNDIFALLRPTDGMTPDAYNGALSSFFATADRRSRVKKVLSVEDGGLLALLLANTTGAKIDLSRLSNTIQSCGLPNLAAADPDACVVCLALRDYQTVSQQAADLSLTVHPFASATNESRFVFFKDQTHVEFSLETDLLRLLIPHHTGSAGLPSEEKDAASEPISHTLRRKDTAEATLLQNGLLLASATLTPQKAFFRNAIDTALVPALTLSANGADYADMGLTLSLTYSQNQIPAAIATALGLYRLQAELGIPALFAQTEQKSRETDLKLTVSAVSANALPPLPNRFVEAHHALYCLAPTRDPDELPDFAALREMLSYLTALSRANAIKSFYVVCRESLPGAIRSMRTESLSCRITDDIWACEEALPLAILIESDRTDLRARRIGTVIERIGAPRVEEQLSQSSF